MDLLLASTAIPGGTSMTIGLTKAQADIELYNGTDDNSMVRSQNRHTNTTNRAYTALANDFAESITLFAGNAGAADDRMVKLAIYEIVTGDIVPGSEHTFAVAPSSGAPVAQGAHTYTSPLALTEGLTYAIVAVNDGSFAVTVGDAFNATGFTSQQESSPDDTINDPFLPTGTVLSRDFIMSAQVTTIEPEDSPTLTLPFPIGNDGGPMFSATSSDTIATVEAADFLNNIPGWASLLTTDDVVIIECSNGTKMYTVTVNRQARIITLSTGLVIV